MGRNPALAVQPMRYNCKIQHKSGFGSEFDKSQMISLRRACAVAAAHKTYVGFLPGARIAIWGGVDWQLLRCGPFSTLV